MKYDKDTMNSLQEAYASVNETYKGGEIVKPNRNKQTGNPPVPRDQSSKTSSKKLKGPMSTGGDGTAYYGEEQEHEGMTRKNKQKLKRQKQLLDASKNAPVAKNKIVPMEARIEEAIKMSRKEYAIKEVYEITPEEEKRTHTDFINRKTKHIMIQNPETKGSKRVPYVVKNKNQKTDDAVKNESVEKNCGCGQTPCKTYGNVNEKKKEMDDKMKEVEDMRSLPTRMNLIKTKLRAMGLNMSHQLKGKELSEVINYTLNELNRSERETGIDTKTGKPIVKGGTKKPNFPKVSNPALDKVKKSIQAAGGKIMRSGSNQQKKVRGGPTGGGGKYLKMYQDKVQLKKDAEEMGHGDDVQGYVERRARYGSKENIKSGRGLGS